MIETIRKCKSGKDEIILERERAIYYKDAYHHVDCLVKYLIGKKKFKDSKEIWDRKEAEKYVEELFLEGKNKIDEIVDKNHLYKWIQKNYSIVSLPQWFYEKMEQIFTGKWKDMSQGILPSDMFDMWKRKKDYLDKVYNKNVLEGKSFDNNSRLNYDVAILISRYPSYCEWKKQNTLSMKELQTEIASNQIDLTRIPKNNDNVIDYIIEDNED